MTYTVLLTLILFAVTCTRLEAWKEELEEPSEKANYYLHKLKENVDRMKRSWSSPKSYIPTSHVSKRSTKRRADDLILNSLSSYCLTFKSDPAISDYLKKSSERQPLKYRDVSGYSKYEQDRNLKNEDVEDSEPSSRPFLAREPSTIPVKILAQRDEKSQQVWYIFYIAHSTTVEIARIDRFQPPQKTILTMPRDACFKVVSKARFVVDMVKSCRDSNDRLEDIQATFQITDTGKTSDVITIAVDLCRFDIEYGPKTKKGIMSTKRIPIPTFRLSQSHAPSDQNIPYRRQTGIDENEMTFDLDVETSSYPRLSIHLALWDSNFDNFMQTSAVIRSVDVRSYVTEKNVIQTMYSNIVNNNQESVDPNDRIFNIQVLKKSASKAKLRISMNNDRVQNRSGRLTLSYLWKETKYSLPAPIAESIRVDRNFPINITGSFGDLPEGLLYFHPRQRFFCDKYGDRMEYGGHYPGRDKNCTVKCEAFGRDISTIYLTTPDNVKTNVRSTSLVLPRKAVAIAKVGISSDGIQGNYQCTAVTERGKSYTRDLKLYTSNFVTIDKFTIVDPWIKEKNLLILCEVSGSNENLNIEISISEDLINKVRLDNDESLYLDKNVTSGDDHNTTSLSLLLSWKHLRAPRNYLHCDARGKFGSVSNKFGIKWYNPNTKGMLPAIEKKKLKKENLKNSTSIFTCVARGVMPMRLFFTRSGSEQSLENLSDTYTATHVIGKTMTLTYTVPDYHIPRDGALVCRAFNDFGKDWEYFYYKRD